MHSISRLKHVLFHHQWNPEIIEYYVYLSLRTIAFMLVSLFLPLYLLIDLQYSLLEISLFFTINQILYSISLLFSGFIIKKIGVKHSIALHLPGLAIFWYLLRFLTGDFLQDLPLIFFMLIIRVALKAPLGSAEVLFTHYNILKKDRYGTSLAYLKIILVIATILAPIVGGVITFLFGFEQFFNVNIVVLLLSALPLFLTKDRYFRIKYNPTALISFTTHKLSKDFIWSMAGRSLPEVVIWGVWPIFVYLIVKNTLELGVILSLASLIAIVGTYLIGKEIDKGKSAMLLKQTTGFATVIFFLRVVFVDPISIVITDALNKIVNPMLLVSYERYMYEYLKKEHDLLKTSIAMALVYEFTMFLGFGILTLFLWMLQHFLIEITYWVFIVIFIFFGAPLVLMPRIIKTVKE